MLSLLVLLLTLAGYSFPTFAEDEDPLFTSIRKAGEVKVGLASFPPYVILTPSGKPTGSSIDLQNMVLERMGLPALTPVLLGPGGSEIPGLMARQFDYIGDGEVITEERCKAAIFSAPYYAAQFGLFVRPGNPKHLTSVSQVAQRLDVKLAVLPGSAQETYARKQGLKSEQLVIVPDPQAGIATVTGGRADALVISQFNIVNPDQKGVELVVDEQSPLTGVGIIFRKENAHFRDEFSKQLNFLVRSGTVQKLYEKYGIPNGDTEAKLLAKFNKAGDVVPTCE